MGRYTHDIVEAADTPTAGDVFVAQAATAIPATMTNELSYRMAEGGSGRSHTLADDLSFQRGDHTPGRRAGSSSTKPRPIASRPTRRTGGTSTATPPSTSACATRRRASVRGWASRGARGSGRLVRGGFGVYHSPHPIRQWNLGLGRTLYDRGTFDVTYAGANGDGGVDPASLRYHGLLASFRHEAAGGLLDVSYTLSRNRTLDVNGEWGDALGDRTHVFTASYVRALGGWRIAGITTFQSGPPAPPIVLVDDGTRAHR